MMVFLSGHAVAETAPFPVRGRPSDGIANGPCDAALDAIARRARAGEDVAAASLCAELTAAVRAYFHRALGNDDEVDDATQHVMLQLVANLPTYDDRGTPFRAFVFRVAHNHALDRRAARMRIVATEPSELDRLREAEESPAAPEAGERRDSFDALVSLLPPTQQRVVRLIYLHDLTPAQAGLVLGRSAEDVRQLHSRARARLRQIVMADSE
jgi:RNA polymerase sigma-70 factor (ECF subfamily)